MLDPLEGRVMRPDSSGVGPAYLKVVLAGGIFIVSLLVQLVVFQLLAPDLLERISPLPFALTSVLVVWMLRGWIGSRAG